ncbi:unnamed protein product [Phytomonas sp. Hart1]|nr:unnamed protein product [Phytomonas sp. Hart1]|eukprot:CCW67800.1 unnamed protein product [Phytomonas sp. isolate Hart1]
MLQCARVVRAAGKVLYPTSSTIARDFYDCCRHVFEIKLHEETFIGERSSQVRGLFLSMARQTSLPSNQPIATIPLATLYTETNIHEKLNTLQHLRTDHVRDAIADEEFKLMAPQLYIGMQIAAITAALPDISKVGDAEEYAQITEILSSGANPWARIYDDEDFSDKFVFGMYGMTLDSWQRNSYDEMIDKFNRSTTLVHDKFKLPFKIHHFRRMARLVIARLEHMPPFDYYNHSFRVRQWRRNCRRLFRLKEPSELTLIPLLDLVNHSNRPNCAIRVGPSALLGGDPAITLFSLTTIAPGEELCRHYNFALNRASALFRYGFLPFDLIAIIEHNSIEEHFVRNRMEMDPIADGEIARLEAENREVERLEKIFQEAKRNH